MAYIDKVAVKVRNTTTNYKVATSLYGTCNTDAATAEKVVTLDDFNDFSTGVTIKVKFTNSNTASNPTLNVNSKGAKSIYRFGTTTPGTNIKTSWNAGAIVSFTYDGSAWVMNDWINDDTTNTDTKVTQTAASDNSNYEVLFSATADNETRTETAKKSSNLKFNPSTGNLQATTYNGLTLATSGSLTNDSSIIPNSKTVKSYVDGAVANATHFRGSFNASNGKIDGGSSTLTSVAEIIGDVYVCDTAGTYVGTAFEIGDSIIFKREVNAGTAPVAADIVAVESTVSVSVPSTVPAPSAGDTATLATVEGVDIKIKLPNDNDTKNTAGSTDTSSKIFLVGATSQAANPQTYSHDTVYVGTDGCLYSGGTKVLTAHQDISGKVNKSGDTMTGRLTIAKPINPIITGTGTTAQDKGAGVSPRFFPAKWTFDNGQTLMDGDVITIKIPCEGHDYGVFISIDNGITYKPISIVGTGRLITQYPVGAFLTLVYRSDGATNNVFATEGANVRSNITGGCWLVLNYYDSGNAYDRNRFNANIKAWGTKILGDNIIVGINGVYHHLKEGTAFDITYPILFLAADCNANSTTTSTYDILNFGIATTQNITLTAYKPVYIKGTLSGTIFTPESTTPLTQTVPTSADGKYYIFLGNATSSTMVYLTERHEIYAYKNGVFGQIVNDALSVNGYTVAKSVPSDAVFTDTKVTVNTIQPAEATNYYLTLASSSGTGILGGNLGIKAHLLEGTTEAEGIGGLTLGNSTAIGTDGNQKGYIYMYSTTNKYGTIEQGDITSNVTHTLPSSTGILLNDDNYSTYVKKVNSTVATDTSYKYGGIPFYNNWNNTSEVKDILHNDGISYSYKNGTTSAVGESYIQLGNNIASGTAGNKKGFVLLYGQNTGYTILTTNQNNTSNYNLELPTKSGTLATVDDVQTRLGILKWRNTNTVTVAKTITITGNFYRSAYVGSPTSIIRFFKPQLSDYANNKLLEANLFSAYTAGSGGTNQVDFVSGKDVYTVTSNNDYSGFFDIGSISTGITSSVSTPEEQSLTITMTMRFWAGAALMIEYDQSVYTITIT